MHMNLLLLTTVIGNDTNEVDIRTWLTTLLIFLGIAALFVFLVCKTIRECRQCTQPVQAVCVDAVAENGFSDAGYAAVWEYEYGGQRIRSQSNFYKLHGQRDVGTHCTLYVDPEHPEIFRKKIPQRLPTLIVLVIMMLVVGGAVISDLITMLHT